MNLDVRALQLVLAIHEEGGVTRAGERLNVTQSALSHQLREVEDRLRTPLFRRVRKRMVITPAGETVLRLARRVLSDMTRTEEEIRQLTDGDTGTIRISTQCYTCYHWLPAILLKFNKRYPDVDVRVDISATRHAVRALLEGRLDVAIVSDVPEEESVELTPLFGDELLILLPGDHRLADRKAIRPASLQGEHLLLHVPAEDSTVVQEVLKPAGAWPIRCSQVELTEAIVELVRARIGITVLADWVARAYDGRGGLRAIPFTRPVRRQWYAATLREERMPPFRRRFLELLSEMNPPAPRR